MNERDAGWFPAQVDKSSGADGDGDGDGWGGGRTRNVEKEDD